ncbi:MAG: hypothetical protein KAW49_03225, partial [Anaerolineae bacterium]|nr:hypothetical protein [Anaerolineae bacterium]
LCVRISYNLHIECLGSMGGPAGDLHHAGSAGVDLRRVLPGRVGESQIEWSKEKSMVEQTQ